MINLMRTLTAAYIILFSLNLLCSSTSTGLAMVEKPWAKIAVVICGILTVYTGGMLAFITNSAKREAEGKPLIPINGGDTTITRKTDIQSTETQTTKTDK